VTRDVAHVADRPTGADDQFVAASTRRQCAAGTHVGVQGAHRHVVGRRIGKQPQAGLAVRYAVDVEDLRVLDLLVVVDRRAQVPAVVEGVFAFDEAARVARVPVRPAGGGTGAGVVVGR